MPTLHTNLSQITHGWSKILGLSKLGMFLYDLRQKVMFDAHQIAGKYVHQGWQKINIENFPIESPHFSIAKEFFFSFYHSTKWPKVGTFRKYIKQISHLYQEQEKWCSWTTYWPSVHNLYLMTFIKRKKKNIYIYIYI